MKNIIPVLQANNLSYKYDDKTIFKNISFTLNRGDMLIVKGPNGSGKSTLLSLILDEKKPFSGNMTSKTYIDNTSYVGMQGIMEDSLTIGENIKYWSSYQGFFPFQEASMFESNIQNILNKSSHKISSGQEKKANLTQIFFNPLPIWILDEPFIALDKKYRKLLLNYFELHRSIGGIIIVTTHLDFHINKPKYILL